MAGCTGPQHALDARGPDAARIAELWWVMFALATAVSLLVTILLIVAVVSGVRRRSGLAAREAPGRVLVWGGGVILPVLVLFPLLIYSFRIGAAVYPPLERDRDPGVLTIEVIGHQFWWEVRYPEHGIATANEIRMPAGEEVRFLVHTPDVIHSFWVPQLHGKIDMIPGRLNELWVRADGPGLFRGQCAEFCGLGHALMAFWVEAMAPAEFSDWVSRRQAPPAEPPGTAIEFGREVFFAAGCGHCHATRGAPLAPQLGTVGPDLRDLAVRRTLAAGTLPNTRQALAEWISDPLRFKPGSRMPPTRLPDAEMEALLDYLETLR